MKVIETYEVKMGTVSEVEMPRGARLLATTVRMEAMEALGLPELPDPSGVTTLEEAGRVIEDGLAAIRGAIQEAPAVRQVPCVWALVDPTLPKARRKLGALIMDPTTTDPVPVDDSVEAFVLVGTVQIGPYTVLVFDGGEVLS